MGMYTPAMSLRLLAVFVLAPMVVFSQSRSSDTIQARFYAGAAELNARPDKLIWKKVRPVMFQHDWRGDALVGHATTVRAAWTATELWLLFSCSYDALRIGTDPQTSKETDKLWSLSDVAEAFIAPNPADVMRYKEFQVSPAGEWVDLHIDRESKSHDVKWDSGFRSAAWVDNANQTWWAEMAIPLKAFGVAQPAPGARWRLNFYRIEHGPPQRYIAWQPTHTEKPNFHVPQSFGWIQFMK